jgi:hypothetical protein
MCTSVVADNQTLNSSSPKRACSAKFLAKRNFELPLTFAEIVDLSEKCDLWELETASRKTHKPPITFTIPTAQLVASISRVVE